MDDFKFLPHIKGLIDFAKANPAPGFNEISLQELREARNAAIKMHLGPGPDLPRVVDHQVPVQGGQITLRLFYPDAPGPLPVLLWFHAGGWVVGSLETHDSLFRKLAAKCGICLAGVEYRLSPEHRFPTPVNDCLDALLWLAGQAAELGLDPARIMLGGDSAGGGMVISVALLARQAGGPALSKLVSVYPVTDLASFDKPTYRTYWDKLILSGPAMEFFREQFLAKPEDAANPLASPLLAPDLSGLPPTLLITAEHDVLTSDGELMAEKLRQAGVEVEYCCLPGVIHLALGMAALNEEENGMRVVADFLK